MGLQLTSIQLGVHAKESSRERDIDKHSRAKGTTARLTPPTQHSQTAIRPTCAPQSMNLQHHHSELSIVRLLSHRICSVRSSSLERPRRPRLSSLSSSSFPGGRRQNGRPGSCPGGASSVTEAVPGPGGPLLSPPGPTASAQWSPGAYKVVPTSVPGASAFRWPLVGAAPQRLCRGRASAFAEAEVV